jgi:hypothetical protein
MATAQPTARFSALVKAAGAPAILTPWKNPLKQPDFRKALKEDRILTLHQANVGTRKDYGTVGYDEKARGTLLLFGKSLTRFKGKRIVGIKYQLLRN